ncbi:MAG: hypothetical protein IT385_12130 [Deltaproteobacteria bacterium]|nr:hypothetical protein [Deltaproteobacteria bacterium]
MNPQASVQRGAAASKPAPVTAEGPQLDSKTKQLVGRVEGHAAQSALLAPDKQAPVSMGAAAEDKVKADAKGPLPAPAEVKADAPPPADLDKADTTGKLSPIRQALLDQFNLLEGKGVGDKEFDAICSEATWTKKKNEEQAAKDKADADHKVAMADYEAKCAADPSYKKTHPKPQKAYVPIYTTCIDTMRVVAAAAWKASGMVVKRASDRKFDMFSFGSASRTEGKKIDAWVESGAPASKSPKTGDMIMLEKAGGKVDKASEEKRGADLNFAVAEKRLQKELKNLEAAAASSSGAFGQAAAARAPQVQAALEKLRASYEEAKQKIQAKIAEAQAGLAKRVGEGAKLEFSHVGFFKDRQPEIGPDGQPTGREVWSTFDGGQSGIAHAVGGQGAKAGKRYYDPQSNMVTGEASQGGAMRWLAGWIDVDKMVKGQAEKKDA